MDQDENAQKTKKILFLVRFATYRQTDRLHSALNLYQNRLISNLIRIMILIIKHHQQLELECIFIKKLPPKNVSLVLKIQLLLVCLSIQICKGFGVHTMSIKFQNRARYDSTCKINF